MILPVVVAGEALIDLAPRTPDTLAAMIGGGPFNTARALGRLGQPTAFIGCVSRDRFGRDVAAALAADGVQLDDRLRTDRPTSMAMAEIDEAGTATYRFHLSETSTLELTPALALAVLPETISALHIGSLGLALDPMATALEAMAARVSGRALVMADPNVRPAVIDDFAAFKARLDRVLVHTDVLKVSDADLAILSPGVAPLEAARGLLAKGPRLVLLTLGSKGAVALNAFGAQAVAAPEVTVKDTIGAGDTFSGAWLARWLELDCSLDDVDAVTQATRFACRAAALSCTTCGATPPTRAEMAAFEDSAAT